MLPKVGSRHKHLIGRPTKIFAVFRRRRLVQHHGGRTQHRQVGDRGQVWRQIDSAVFQPVIFVPMPRHIGVFRINGQRPPLGAAGSGIKVTPFGVKPKDIQGNLFQASGGCGTAGHPKRLSLAVVGRGGRVFGSIFGGRSGEVVAENVPLLCVVGNT